MARLKRLWFYSIGCVSLFFLYLQYMSSWRQCTGPNNKHNYNTINAHNSDRYVDTDKHDYVIKPLQQWNSNAQKWDNKVSKRWNNTFTYRWKNETTLHAVLIRPIEYKDANDLEKKGITFVPTSKTGVTGKTKMKLCPKITNGNATGLEDKLKQGYQMTSSGLWLPIGCRPRHVTAVIVPYRDRARNLQYFLSFMPSYLQQQWLAYIILVVEQKSPIIFNRGYLLNIGLREVQKLIPDLTCCIFHDVDLIPAMNSPNSPGHHSDPSDQGDHGDQGKQGDHGNHGDQGDHGDLGDHGDHGDNKDPVNHGHGDPKIYRYAGRSIIPYSCKRDNPVHLAAYVNSSHYQPTSGITGGVFAITPRQMEQVNGYSNIYWGWGGEDADLYNRLATRGIRVVTGEPDTTRYNMLPHGQDKHNPVIRKRFYPQLTDWSEDGLNSLHYSVLSSTHAQTHAHVEVALRVNAETEAWLEKKYQDDLNIG